jgi:lipopolysaccharide/colanic/teichoic acid biosynthesis glycosyltransferase
MQCSLIMKRAFDIALCLLALLFIFPFFVIIGIVIKIYSPGPVFYRGIRSGLNGKPFRIFKFRTMVPDADKIGGPSTGLNDPRLTKSGAFLRKYKLDELPQLLNVLAGDMSIVGPRPQVEKYTRLYTEEQKIILSVRPGITDYASIRFINLDEILGDENVDEKYLREIEPEKNKLRMKYVRDQSLTTDFKIIAITILQMLHICSLWNIES